MCSASRQMHKPISEALWSQEVENISKTADRMLREYQRSILYYDCYCSRVGSAHILYLMHTIAHAVIL